MENNLRRSISIGEPNKEDKNGPPKKATQPIKIHGDIIQKFLEWVPLKSLPNVLLTNKRFFGFGNESLDERKRTIYRMKTRDYGFGLSLQMVKRGESKSIAFPEADPPMKFRVQLLQIPRMSVNAKTKDFLRFSKSLFIGTVATFGSKERILDPDDFDEVSAILDQCMFIETRLEPALLVRHLTNLFSCSRLIVWAKEPRVTIIHDNYGPMGCRTTYHESKCSDVDLSADSMINWLHHPLPEWDTSATQRQIIFHNVRYKSNQLQKLRNRLEKKFKEDTTGHTFVLRFPIIKEWSVEKGRIENSATGEVLFTSIIGNKHHDLIRCPKKDEHTTTYEDLPNFE